MLRDPATAKICAKCISVEVDTPQSSYKALFEGMSLGTALLRMSSKKVAPMRSTKSANTEGVERKLPSGMYLSVTQFRRL